MKFIKNCLQICKIKNFFDLAETYLNSNRKIDNNSKFGQKQDKFKILLQF